MSFRTRLLISFAALSLAPLLLFGAGMDRELERRLTAQQEMRTAALAASLGRELTAIGERIDARLTALARSIPDDNRFRAGLAGSGTGSEYVLDYAGRALALSGLSMLQIQNEEGRILSSGHFRNEYGRLEPGLAAALAEAPGGTALLRARTPTGPLLVLAGAESFRLGGQRFTLVGGVEVHGAWLRRMVPDPSLTASLRYPDGAISTAVPRGERTVVTRIPLTFVDAAAPGPITAPGAEPRPPGAEPPPPGTAQLVIRQSLDPLRALQRDLRVWLLAALGLTGAAAATLAWWVSGRIGRPLATLARKTARLDLDRLDIDFHSDRKDEIGTLSRRLGTVTSRLRNSVERLRAAERRAAVGDLARQVNHDVRNGLAPIRHVLRHLAEVARDTPGELAGVFRERQATLESSVEYLQTLAADYARLVPRGEARPCDVNEAVRDIAEAAGRIENGGESSPPLDAGASAGSEADGRRGRRPPIRLHLTEPLPAVLADPVALRRVLENLVRNAVESLPRDGGDVILTTSRGDGDAGGGSVRIEVADTGRGMDEEELERALEDFYTTREGGTGLGLSIVRRLLADMGGKMAVASKPGAGSQFTVELPALGTLDPKDAGPADRIGGAPSSTANAR